MECHFDALPCTPFCLFEAFHPQGSVSLDSRIASLPYESSSLATSRGNESVTGINLSAIWHDKHSGDWLTAFATPYPALPNFPLCRGQNKALKSGPFISSSQHNGAL